MFFNLFFILQLVLQILHVLHQILTQSTPNSQQIKPINLVNKPTQIKPRSRNQSQQTQKNTIKPRSNPDQHNQTQIPPPLTNTIKLPPPTTLPTKPKMHPTDQSPYPPISQKTLANKVTKPTTTIVDQKKREEEGFCNHQWIRQRPRLSSIMAETEAKTGTEAEIELYSL